MGESSRNQKSSWLMLLGSILVIVALILVIWFFLRGKTTISGSTPGISKDNSMSCTISDQEYPFFRDNNAEKTETKIIALFDDANFKSISLLYTLYFNNNEQVKNSEANNHAAMNIHYGEDGLLADALYSAYSMQEKKLTFSISAGTNDFNTTTSKYFLASGYGRNVNFDTLLHNYVRQGFNCTANE